MSHILYSYFLSSITNKTENMERAIKNYKRITNETDAKRDPCCIQGGEAGSVPSAQEPPRGGPKEASSARRSTDDGGVLESDRTTPWAAQNRGAQRGIAAREAGETGTDPVSVGGLGGEGPENSWNRTARRSDPPKLRGGREESVVCSPSNDGCRWTSRRSTLRDGVENTGGRPWIWRPARISVVCSTVGTRGGCRRAGRGGSALTITDRCLDISWNFYGATANEISVRLLQSIHCQRYRLR